MTTQTLNGLYLVIDPAVERELLLAKVRDALEGGIDILQIWNHWPDGSTRADKESLITDIQALTDETANGSNSKLARASARADYAQEQIPILINEEWELLTHTDIDGVHFDEIPQDFDRIRAEIGREFIAGITCGNDLDTVRWADEQELDYISFCAMFPSSSVDSCEIVRLDTVRQARELTDLPLFLSGGLTPGRIKELDELEFNGVAVISGILSADQPGTSATQYQQALHSKTT